MATTNKIPGIFAGRLTIDMNAFDPRATSLHNPFRDPPVGFIETDATSDPLPFNNVCNHTFTVKPEQTLVDLPTDRPDGSIQGSARGKVGAICQKCNWHLDFKIQWTQEDPQNICPTKDSPLHFFVVSQLPTVNDVSGLQSYHFGCQTCETKIEICYRPPRLTYDYHDLLTNPGYLQARADAASRKEPGRQGVEPQPGIKVLEALTSYLNDALKGKATKGIPAYNKRFMASFGEDCVPLLAWLGFTKKSPDASEGPDGNLYAEHETWMLPQVQPMETIHSLKAANSTRVRLDDIMEELWAAMRRMPAGQMAIIKHRPPALVPADPPIIKLLGADSYDRAAGVLSRGRRPVPGSESAMRGGTEDECYEGLGIARDFATSLVLRAFRKQVAWLPDQAAFFYDCMVAVSERRVDEEMNINLATLASEGYVSRVEIRDAYRYMGFTVPLHASAQEYFASLSDNEVLGHFDSRLQNVPKRQEAELRSRLRIIGRARGSTVIESASENEITNEASALRWLDPTYNGTVAVSDEHVVAMAVSKLAEAHGNSHMEETCNKAVAVIAQERNSETLKTWILTKDDGGGDLMDPEEVRFNNAKRYFDIPDTQSDIDLNVLESFLHMRITDDPTSAEEAQRHFEVIRERLRLLEQRKLQTGGIGALGNRGDYTMPVGLTNMGNTCYLNSYLQFFFAVKPLRELIFEFDRFKLDIEDPKFVPKTVDGLSIGKDHTKKAQEFVGELQSLFKQMATAPGPVVDPTWQLAVLALETGPLAAQAVVSARRATVTGMDNLPIVLSPTRATLREPAVPENDNIMGLASASGGFYGVKSTTANSSEVTLIESNAKTPDTDMEVHMGDDTDAMLLDDEDRHIGTKGKQRTMSSGMTDLIPDRMDPEAMPLLPSDAEDEVEEIQTEPTPPQRPPPVPPRPGPNHPMYGPLNRSEAMAAVPPLLLPSDTSKNTNRMKAEAAAQQQDVDEAMGNVLFKIQCSIQSTPIPGQSSSQQVSTDLIKDTFNGQFVWKYLDGKTDPMDEGFSAINISLAESPENVTAGLDNAFGLDVVSLDGKRTRRYRTITRAPPVFQIYLQRQYFDPTRGDAVINKHFIQLEEQIYLDRFMSAENPELQRLREKAWKMDSLLQTCRKKRDDLSKVPDDDSTQPTQATAGVEAEKILDANANVFPGVKNKVNDSGKVVTVTTKTGPELLDDTWMWVSRNEGDLNPTSELLNGLRREAEARRKDIVKLDNAIARIETEKKALFDQYKQHAYRLAAVFVHRGQGGARGGHYWIYICDFESKQNSEEEAEAQSIEESTAVDVWGEALTGMGIKWRRYEDSDVRLVKDVTGEIFSETDPEKDGAPYFLVYVREEGKDQIVDPVYRVKPPTPSLPPADVGQESGEMDVDEAGGVPLEYMDRNDERMDLDSDPFMGAQVVSDPPAVIAIDSDEEQKLPSRETENWMKGG